MPWAFHTSDAGWRPKQFGLVTKQGLLFVVALVSRIARFSIAAVFEADSSIAETVFPQQQHDQHAAAASAAYSRRCNTHKRCLSTPPLGRMRSKPCTPCVNVDITLHEHSSTRIVQLCFMPRTHSEHDHTFCNPMPDAGQQHAYYSRSRGPKIWPAYGPAASSPCTACLRKLQQPTAAILDRCSVVIIKGDFGSFA